MPKGFRFAVAAARIKNWDRNDLALVVSDVPAASAGTLTRNLYPAAPVQVAREILALRPTARAVLVNAGNANACTGDRGLADCRRTVKLLAEAAGLDPEDVLPASTGVIGQPMDMSRWEAGVPALVANLGKAGAEDFARAIMTTDNGPKMAGRAGNFGPGRVSVLGMAKGAGMIAPNMATMIGVVLTDADVEPDLWREILGRAVGRSFNRVVVDGDTSTNDTVFGLANGASGVKIDSETVDALERAVTEVCQDLAWMIAADAEGGTKVMRIKVRGAASDADAEAAARAVGTSPLVKTAMYGKDANWGRIVAALGRCGVNFDPDAVVLEVAGVALFRDGLPLPVDEDAELKPALERREIPVDIVLGDGPGEYELLASDLTHEYVSINADYRT